MMTLNEFLFQFNLNIFVLFLMTTAIVASLFFWRLKKPKQIKILLLFVFFALSMLPFKSFSIPQNGGAQVKESQSEKTKKDSGKSKKDSKKNSKSKK
jgi:hypothetical protein